MLAPGFWRRLLQLNLGLMLFGLGIALMLKAGIGLDPWSVFHEGLANQTGLSFGRVTQLTGVLLIALSFALLRVKPGLATVLNMLLVGPWVDFYRAQAWLPTAEGWLWGVLQFMAGVVLVGLASGLYIAARFGAGPRDGFVLGLSLRLRLSVRLTRSGLELLVLVSGFLLGGPLGLGTVLFAITVGYFMQRSLRLFRYQHGPVAPAASPAD
ncbi:MAG: hypothetical protein KGZ60_07230 [Truepera sp.]|nr:hypothetical protein [Truepera sp.]